MRSPTLDHRHAPGSTNRPHRRIILALGILSLFAYGLLAVSGDLRERLQLYLPIHAVLLLGMVAARRQVVSASTLRWLLAFGLAFRLVAVVGPPALSDDIYRYVWDGRVQLAGEHPYRYAPVDPALEPLRDQDWARINHPEIPTVYPPVAERLFAGMAWLGWRVQGFRLGLGLIDAAGMLLLLSWLRARRRPVGRVAWYAWNPLAVMEIAGSGHVDGIGAMALVVGWLALGASIHPQASAALRRGGQALLGAAVATATWIKLLPLLVLVPLARRMGRLGWAGFAAVTVLAFAPYAWTGPAWGGGVGQYASRWRYNAFLFGGIEAAWNGIERTYDFGNGLKRGIGRLQAQADWELLPFDWMYRHVWPPELSRLTVGGLLLIYAVALVWSRRRLGSSAQTAPAIERDCLRLLGAALLLMPTFHPWYVLTVLPLAVALQSWGWLYLSAALPLAYLAVDGDVPWSVKTILFVPAMLLMVVQARARSGTN